MSAIDAIDATAYVCIAAGVLAMVPWQAILTRVTAFRSKAQPAGDAASQLVDAAPAGVAEYAQAMRHELSKEDSAFVLDCICKGMSVTEAIKNAYNGAR